MELTAFLFIVFVYLISPEDKNVNNKVKVNSPMYGTFEGCIIMRRDQGSKVYLIRKRFGGYVELLYDKNDTSIEITKEKC